MVDWYSDPEAKTLKQAHSLLSTTQQHHMLPKDKVVIVGVGPVGLTTALSLAACGVNCVIIEARSCCNPAGSRASVIDHGTLSHLRQIECVSEILKQGLVPKARKTFYKNHLLYGSNFPQPQPGELPRFLNLSQVQTEAALLAKANESPFIDILWNHRFVRLEQDSEQVTLYLENAGNDVTLTAGYVVGADGCKSKVRECCGLKFEGLTCPTKFRIVDIRAELDRPKEYHFHFRSRQNPKGAFLIVPQPDNVHRIDWQMPADYDHVKDRANLDWHVQRAIGGATPFEIIWDSCYQFQQRLVNSMTSGRVFLAGDAAHLVAPFGARGMNSGIQDARMIAGLLARVLKGREPAGILESYSVDRGKANAKHQQVTRKTMRFISPPNTGLRLLRDSILVGSRSLPKLRQFVDSGSMSNAPLAPFPTHLICV